MPVSKRDAERALAIIENLITQGESSLDTKDIMKSPLFSSLVQIQSQYDQTVREKPLTCSSLSTDPGKKTGLRLESDPTLLFQFQQRYGITNAEMHPNRFAIAKLSTEATKDGSHIEHSGQSPVFFQPETVSSFPSTFVGDLSFEEPQKERSKSLKKPVRKVTTTKLFSRKASTVSTGSVSLADLAAVTVITNSGNELSDIIHNSSIALGNAVASSESSLSSFISDVSKPSLLMAIEQETFPTACQPKSPQNNEDSVEALRQQEGKIEITDENMYVTPDMCSCPVDKLFVSHEQDQEDSQSDIDLQVVSSTDAVITNWDVKCGKRTARSQNWYAEIEETDKPKDSLFFMRDEGSQAKIREIAKPKQSRYVTLKLPDGRGVGLGMDLVGVSSTGVFVSELYPGCVAFSSGLIHEGDQVLQLNQHDTRSMASFEVDMLIREISPGSEIYLVLIHNPIGWIEYQKLCQ
ncbi:uncharacterized protein LOC135346647 isoform X2 [Halichondria panicea]|uniref:uncharacterized protein LOC135346647 isoform X2 n=1 Tax=Halichondria panicea TaxID=6063 RepID=UPI00312B76B7